ncbi:MAG TPA: SPOR domain-containing protein [Candidatus Ignatzschineria merdigallinarum]|uniref:SPOR domain-containing protein n=1 Tax=Candidatus Ignatzschineria merdigallinarum TaxID=2838621 RepID=A0A9D1TTI2_9GAMM|nr:SPOR domain-containing protein [Candidatus Ignatzschineria merdigallinarum]
MSNTQEKPILQRAVGAIFLLALIALVAVLLLQPSDQLPESTAKNSKPQQPTISITANNDSSKAPELNTKSPEIVLESTTSASQITENTPVEVIGEDLWQSVEQQTSQAVESTKPILIASTEPSNTIPKTVSEKPKATEPPKTANTTAAPKTEATKPKVAAPKLELIADSEKAPVTKPTSSATTSKNNQGKWYVQIGAFGNSANAQKLVNQYQQQGYTVRIQKDNNLNRVQIGPFSTKKEAEQVQAKTKTQSINPAVIHLP